MKSSQGTPSKIGYIPSLNGIRALSVAVVFWAHAGMPGGVRGGAGVTVFFFLSGFLITTLLRAEFDRFDRISLKDFYVRRILRIVPPMVIAITIGACLVAAGILGGELTAGGLSANGFFFTNYWIIAGFEGFPDGLGVLWSLAVEEHYYMVFPLVYIALRVFVPRRAHQVSILAAVCVVILVWRSWLVLGEGVEIVRVYYATDTRVDGILLGAILAIGFNPVYGEVSGRVQRFLPVASTIGALAFIPFVLPRFTSDVIVYSWGVTFQVLCLIPVFIYVILNSESWFGKILNWRPLNFIGVLSYSIYLVHSMFLHLVEELAYIPWAVGILVAALLSVAVAYAVYVVVERPIAIARRRRRHA